MSFQRLILVVAFVLVLVVPRVLRPPQEAVRSDALPLVIITPHLQSIWYEFGRAFGDWHQERFGRPVEIDWRQPGGTSTISQFLNARFAAVDALRGAPSSGIGVDILFGGGQADHEQQKRLGHLQPCGIQTEYRELLRPEILPQTLAGATLYDPGDHYYGCCLGVFGIVSNTEAMMRRGLTRDQIPPRQWRDLTSPAFYRKTVLSDPAGGASVVKSLEIIIQQAIHETVRARSAAAGGQPLDAAAERAAVADGFRDGLRRMQLIAANARRIARSSAETAVDVSQGEALAAMCIDYYGLVQADAVRRPDGSSRVMFVAPAGGTVPDGDPIAMLRGAPHPEVARRFIRFVLSPEGQRLWCYRVGAPGGPVKYALHRAPIRRDMYSEEHLRFFADSDVWPYSLAQGMTYQPAWTAALFPVIRVFIRAMCVDTHPELCEAWGRMIATGQARPGSPALEALQRMPLTYDEFAAEDLRRRLRDPVEVVRLTRQWSDFFRANYAEAARLAGRPGGPR